MWDNGVTNILIEEYIANRNTSSLVMTHLRLKAESDTAIPKPKASNDL
jgi:hypothetical protein